MKNLIIPILICFLISNIQAQEEYRFIKSSTDSIFYEVAGKGKAVLFLAGGPGGSPESLKPIVDYISKNHYTILIHQRGTGLSVNNQINEETITLDQYIRDIDNILKKEKIKKVYIIGHSWGAMLALDYMVKRPTKVKGLVLIGSSGYSLEVIQSMNNEALKRMTPTEMDSIKVYAEQTYSKNPSLKKEAQTKIMEIMVRKQFYNPSLANELLSLSPINAQVNENMMNDLLKQNWNLQKELEKLNHPVAIINGRYDPINEEEVVALSKALKNSELHILNDCGHYVWLEKAKELQTIIEEFLLNH